MSTITEKKNLITELTFNGQTFASSLAYIGEKTCRNCIHFRPLLELNKPGIHKFVCGQRGDTDELPVYDEATACNLYYQEFDEQPRRSEIKEIMMNGQRYEALLLVDEESNKTCINCVNFCPMLSHGSKAITHFACGFFPKGEWEVYADATACEHHRIYQETTGAKRK